MNGALSGRPTASEITPTGDYQVLAVDALESWSATFRFQVWPSGEFDTETEIARRRDDGSWHELTSGGSRGGGWDLPWRRPEEGWHDHHLLEMGLCGLDVEDDAELTHFLIAVCGFASAATTEIRVRSADLERTIVPAATGAYVALALGNGYNFVDLTPMRHGEELSSAHSAPLPP